MNRPAIIVSSEPPEWGSCKIITPNLDRAYGLCFGKRATRFSVTVESTASQIWKVAQAIYRTCPDGIIFLDHAPHPVGLLLALAECYGGEEVPPVHFHVYGDFTIYTPEWLLLESLLSRLRVKFHCSSHRQQQLVSRFVKGSDTRVGFCPFPVDTSVYRNDPALRKLWRKKLQLKEKELAVIYTGRISFQKNTIALLLEALTWVEASSGSVQIFLAGIFDDLGAPFFGIRRKPGTYYQIWNTFLQKLPLQQRNRVHYLGQRSASELRGLYNAADAYLSLSLHHDEDYGMSPAEALCSGTPCVLTDWGGYASFVHPNRPENAVALVPVMLGTEGLKIQSSRVLEAFFALSEQAGSQKFRNARAESYRKLLSIEAVAAHLKQVHRYKAPRFEGFEPLLRRHAEAQEAGQTLFPSGPRQGTLYEEVYAAYLKD